MHSKQTKKIKEVIRFTNKNHLKIKHPHDFSHVLGFSGSFASAAERDNLELA